jgi:hypothetical protein
METPMKRIIDLESGETVDLPFTDEDLKVYEVARKADALKAKADQDKLDAKSSALAKLAALGLTEDEVNGLIS